MVKSVNLPSVDFRTQKEATEFFRSMLDRYEDGEDVLDEDDTLLFELLQRHPEAQVKIGCGIKRFYRDRADGQATSCFHVERIDGTTTDFSFYKCISSKSPKIEQEFYEACRQAVSQDLTERKMRKFLQAGGKLPCFKTGEIITINESEYRHTSPRFRELVEGFKRFKRIAIDESQLSHSSDMQYVTTFADSEFAEEFKKYHAEHANLEVFKKFER